MGLLIPLPGKLCCSIQVLPEGQERKPWLQSNLLNHQGSLKQETVCAAGAAQDLGLSSGA